MSGIAVRDTARASPVRHESRSEWRVDAVVHALGLVLGITACVALVFVASSTADVAVRLSLAIYGAALLAMLGCSAAYNLQSPDAHFSLWRRLDHAAIFVMIAGTYTPFAAIAIGGAWGTGILIFVWTGAAAGAALKLFHPGRLETLSIIAYLMLGWTILVATEPLIAALSGPALTLLALGGLLYTTGIFFYRWQRLPYHRAIWHGFVLSAAACHYVAILDVVTT